VGTLTRVTHGELREQAAAYALGALSRDERVAFEAHLLDCDECGDEVRSFSSVATALASAVPPAQPGARVRERAVAVSRPSLVPVVPVAPAPVVPRRRVPTLVPWLMAAASMALAAGLSVELVRLRKAAVDTRSAGVVLGAADLVRIDMAGQPVAPRASARAFWSRSRGLIVTASSLPPLPAGRTYQLWIIVGEKPVGAGFIRPGADGAVDAVFTAPIDYANAAAFAVTLEPEGGMPAPTGDKYLVGLVN
jgi:anti-sigma-K factor RskA